MIIKKWPTQAKRVVDGVAYNTQTSTVIASREYDLVDHDGNGSRGTCYLMQTQRGAFYEVDEGEQEVWSQREGANVWKDVCTFTPYSKEQAANWLTIGEVELYHNPFGEFPEAEAASDEAATIYIRLPGSLKAAIEKAASARGASVNTEVVRCLQQCLTQAQ